MLVSPMFVWRVAKIQSHIIASRCRPSNAGGSGHTSGKPRQTGIF